MIITVKDIARELGVSLRTAKRYRVELRAAGLLTPVTRNGKRTAGDLRAIRRALFDGQIRR